MADLPVILKTDAHFPLHELNKDFTGRATIITTDGEEPGDIAPGVAKHNPKIILTCYGKITPAVMDAWKEGGHPASALTTIVKYGVGVDAIDCKAAKERGVVVVNIPEYAENTVAEGAFCLMIALAKKLLPIHRSMQQDGWAWTTPDNIATDLCDKTLGLVGFGRIGKSMARMAQGFNMHVVAYDPHVAVDVCTEKGVTKIEVLDEMLPQCDFVSLHSTLNPDSYHVIGPHQLDIMKPTACLINVSRGALIDEEALVRVMQAGKLGGCGLDVFSKEPLTLEGHPQSPLFKMDNVVLSPHLTFWTEEALKRCEDETIERCLEALEGRPIQIKSKDPRLQGQSSAVYV